jgi:hypothetical protein
MFLDLTHKILHTFEKMDAINPTLEHGISDEQQQA